MMDWGDLDIDTWRQNRAWPLLSVGGMADLTAFLVRR
jgi:hypothetical protein